MRKDKIVKAINDFIEAIEISFNSFDLDRIKKIQKRAADGEFATASDLITELSRVKALDNKLGRDALRHLEKEIKSFF